MLWWWVQERERERERGSTHWDDRLDDNRRTASWGVTVGRSTVTTIGDVLRGPAHSWVPAWMLHNAGLLFLESAPPHTYWIHKWDESHNLSALLCQWQDQLCEWQWMLLYQHSELSVGDFREQMHCTDGPLPFLFTGIWSELSEWTLGSFYLWYYLCTQLEYFSLSMTLCGSYIEPFLKYCSTYKCILQTFKYFIG